MVGCVACGVPDRVARTWPEAYRDLARALDGRKLEATVAPFARSPAEDSEAAG